MRKRLILVVFIVFSSLSSGSDVRFTLQQGDMSFSLDAITVYSISDSTQKLRIYWEIPYAELVFTRVDSVYNAQFEITAIAYDEKGNQAGGDSWRRSYNVTSYEATLAQAESFSDNLDFSLLEGKYKVKVTVRDLHSANRGMGSIEVLVPAIRTENISLSELIFTRDGIPTLDPSFSPEDTIEVVHEIYNPLLLGGYILMAAIRNEGAQRVSEDSLFVEPDSMRTETWNVDISQLKRGNYQFSLSLISKDGKVVDEKSKIFCVEISPFLDDEFFEEAVSQLQYIATNEEMKCLRETKPEERESEWNSFWKEKDPTPSTELNEFKEEYYRRIDYTNSNYGQGRRGWMTDRGKVYIIHGPPDEVERHPYELHSVPYEIWYYYGRGLKFVFVDEHGIGDYRLLSPGGGRW